MEHFKNIWLFLPCLNEEENLASIVEAILNLRIDHLHIALIVDRSTDRTEAIADELHATFPLEVFVLHRRPPASRALAGKDAFLFCLEKGADVIIEMDADFSHDPAYIPQMLAELSDPHIDVVLGSRFLPGGRDTDRSPFRTMVSKLSGVVFRFLLGISLTDMGSGFKAYKREALEAIDPGHLFSEKGLAISMESIFRVLKKGYRVKEIPIIFKDRRFGVSKLSWKDFFEPIFISLRLITSLGRFSKKGGLLNRLRETSWWWGGILAALVVSLLPYWLWGFFGGDRGWEVLWRVPVAPHGIFDTYAHLQQMGLLKAGIVTGAFSWVTWPLLGLIRLFPFASIPEIWIASRWLSTFAMFWLGAWCIRRVTRSGTSTSRWLIVCFWLSFLLVIGMRPGVFSWYLPFGFFGIGLMALSYDALRNDQRVRAFVCSLVALVLLWVYPWFFFYSLLFLVALWASDIIRHRRRLWFVLITFSALVACGFAFLLAMGEVSLWLPASVVLYERNGIMFSHMVLISNTVLASFLWLGLLASSYRRPSGMCREAELFSWLWIVVLAAWLLTPLMGVFLQTDHFVIVVAMLAWMNTALFVSSKTEERVSVFEPSRTVPFAIAAFSSLFLLYVFIKGILKIGNFETYTIHLSIWLALAWSAWFQWIRMRCINVDIQWRKWRWLLIVISLFFGTMGLAVVVKRGMGEVPDLERRIQVIEWLQQHVPQEDAICSDPVNASIYGTHVARQVYPEESNMVLKETDENLHRRLMTIGAAYDSAAAGDEGKYPYFINGLRTSTCAQFAKMSHLLELAGMSRDAIDGFSGCLQERADIYERDVLSVIRSGRVDADAFRLTCPWVIIPDDRKAYWNLPEFYEEIRVDDEVSVWHAI